MDEMQRRTCIAIVNVFEGSSASGDYSAIAAMKGDSGHLSYGKNQVSLTSGNLFGLINMYVNDPDALFSAQLKPYLNRMAAKDISLDTDMQLRAILREAGGDPAMQRDQDTYFDKHFFQPAVAAAQATGLQLPIAAALAYDARVQGGWGVICRRTIAERGVVPTHCAEEDWLRAYVAQRRNWLASMPKTIKTVYRMDAFSDLMKEGKWQLELPLKVHGVNISEQTFGSAPAAAKPAAVPVNTVAITASAADFPVLTPRKPYMKGDDVLQCQKLLSSAGFKNSQDQIYGPFTQALVAQFQKKVGLPPDSVVGSQTWSRLQEATPPPALPS